MNLSFFEILSLFAAMHGIALGLVMCFSKKFNSQGRVFLGLAILAISTLILRDLLEEKNIIQSYQIIYINTWGFPILLGPLIFLYTATSITKPVETKAFRWHFLVPALYFVFLNYTLYKGIASEEEAADHPVVLGVYVFFQLFIVIQVPFYLVWSIRLVRKYHAQLKQEYSTMDKVNLQWLLYLLLAIAAIYLIWMIALSGDLIFLDQWYADHSVNPATFVMGTLIYSIGYFALLRPEVFQVTLQRRKNTLNPAIDPEDISAYKHKITQVMEEQKIYLNQKLTVKDLATELGITPKATSQIINLGFKKSFYDLINSFRIEEAKRNLLDAQNHHLTIEGIALNSGFNSSSTFNRLFKLHTGQTPKSFRTSDLAS